MQTQFTRPSILGSDGITESLIALLLWVLFKCSLSAFSVLSECSLSAHCTIWLCLQPTQITTTSYIHTVDWSCHLQITQITTLRWLRSLPSYDLDHHLQLKLRSPTFAHSPLSESEIVKNLSQKAVTWWKVLKKAVIWDEDYQFLNSCRSQKWKLTFKIFSLWRKFYHYSSKFC